MDPLNPQPQQPQSSFSTPPVMQSAPEPKKKGLLIGILVIVLILIIGALYLFSSGASDQSAADNTLAGDEMQSVQPITNTSDEVDDLQADLDASVDGLDAQNF